MTRAGLSAAACILATSALFTPSLAAQSAQTPAQNPLAGPAEPPLVLSGGTLIDVADWGHSARDIPNAIVIVSDGHVISAGPAASTPIPRNARILDCTGKYLIPGLIDGYAGMNSQGQASADLYMGVTTVVAVAGAKQGPIDFSANPRPNLYLSDSAGATDNWSLLANQPGWSTTLKEGLHPVELSPEDTGRQLTATVHMGTRVIRLGAAITAANAQWIITRAHQLGLITYGDFVATPYSVGVESGVDALVHMGHYELGVIPDELQQPLVQDPFGSAANTAFDYAQRLPPTDLHLRAYARFLATHRAALMPTLSNYFFRLPGHRNLWNAPAASLLNPANLYNPPNRATGELDYPLPGWARHLPGMSQRWLEESQRKKADQAAMRLWKINQTIFGAGPHYLAASGAPVSGSMPGISMHTELELLVRLGLSPREALAAATNNYALQFGWTELGQIAPGRRADILVVDGDPTVNIWNARRISTLILDGNVLNRDALLHGGH
ncbi:MAG TPA: amidohydrolase family protein [Terracidiphilus sp.]|nr:amidohydrolase family protein [Terracidiphilus sp.]